MWAVHVTVRIGDSEVVDPLDALFSTAELACREAEIRSRQTGVVAASVTRFQVDQIGHRSRVALYVHGERQRFPHVIERPRRYVAG